MSASGMRASAFPIAAAPPAFDKFYTFRNPNAYITTESSDSEYTTKLMSQGWTSASLSVGAPLYALSFFPMRSPVNIIWTASLLPWRGRLIL